MILNEFDPRLFLQEYWQKKPCLIKQFVPNFIDPIDENDLAGLAQEDGVDSRIVSLKNHKWQVYQGPFEDFSLVCDGAWTLLVQGVERYFDEIDTLSDYVSFLPNWRFDDVMVSFSMPNASVGAHTDQYDVFIIQGKGSRRWQVGLPGNNQTLEPHKLLKQIKGFKPVIDEVLTKGDAIYIPPQHPHKGVTLTPCLNYSLGFRAPTSLELINGLLDEENGLAEYAKRYADPNILSLRGAQIAATQVSVNEITELKKLMIDLLNSNKIDEPLLQFLSRQGLPEGLPSVQFDFAQIEQALNEEILCTRAPGIKPIMAGEHKNVVTFFIDGNVFETTIALQATIQEILAMPSFTGFPKTITNNEEKSAFVNLMAQLINQGYWLVEPF